MGLNLFTHVCVFLLGGLEVDEVCTWRDIGKGPRSGVHQEVSLLSEDTMSSGSKAYDHHHHQPDAPRAEEGHMGFFLDPRAQIGVVTATAIAYLSSPSL